MGRDTGCVGALGGCAFGARSLFTCDPLTCTTYNISSVTSDDCLDAPDPVTGSCTASPRNRSARNRMTSAGCAGSAPACNGGGCASGQYCSARVSNPNECVCKVGGDGCPGGYYSACRKTAYCQTPWGNADCDVGEASCRICCVVNAPSAPTQISPANGAQLVSGAVSLRWNATADWGGFCPNMARSEAVKQELDSGAKPK